MAAPAVLGVNDVWTSHDDNSRTLCCPDATPCAFHRTFPGSVRSPHMTQDLEVIACAECGPRQSPIETATS